MRKSRSSAVASVASVVLVAVVVAAVPLYQIASPKPAARPGVYVGLSDQRLPVKLTADADRETLSLDVSWVAPWSHAGHDPRRTSRRLYAPAS